MIVMGSRLPPIPSVLPWTPEDVGHVEASPFAPAEDGTGAVDSLGGWYPWGGGGPQLCRYRSKPRYHPHRVRPHSGSKWPWALSWGNMSPCPPPEDISPPFVSV